ncbi:N-acetylmuramic acid 6-phosphate etherase [Haloplasma contractile]|uniref:N-acetylmuramic acid 6-phosphate etherase n=1 Tax=Haloplasma contractile SSD-17B TaxID=1033810 RepID=F7PRC6_9MOLU|nr:N-acetylmuramic acid 6-phosphate etherase [Haloplasma contractile]ERJ11748.1 N-acetylmuramic acid 6-phosphate etherase 2 protein [Haloplasma contractile SSD-17B]
MVDLQNITTEKRNTNTRNIDTLSTLEIVKKINEEDKSVPHSVEKSLPQIAKLIDEVVDKFQKGGRLIYMGAGTSGRIGVLDASECPPTFSTDHNMVTALIAGGQQAMTVAVEGAEDSKELAAEDLKKINVSSNDIVIGITASGRTPYAVGGVEYANEIGVTTGCITTSSNSEIAEKAKFPVEAITGAEPLTGSTRMKSGTAQKLICNMVSTTSMIKLGKVYENLMIDVQQNNKKLVSRAVRIVTEITGLTNQEAMEYLQKYKEVKPAIFAILTGVKDEQEIIMYLDSAKGHLRNAIHLYGTEHKEEAV